MKKALLILAVIIIGIFTVASINLFEKEHFKKVDATIELAKYNSNDSNLLSYLEESSDLFKITQIDSEKFGSGFNFNGKIKKAYLYEQKHLAFEGDYFTNYLVIKTSSNSEDISFSMANEHHEAFVNDINNERGFIVGLGATSDSSVGTCKAKSIAKNEIKFSEFNQGLNSIQFRTPGYFTMIKILDGVSLNGFVIIIE